MEMFGHDRAESVGFEDKVDAELGPDLAAYEGEVES
jgi:hypothetical protein